MLFVAVFMLSLSVADKMGNTGNFLNWAANLWYMEHVSGLHRRLTDIIVLNYQNTKLLLT